MAVDKTRIRDFLIIRMNYGWRLFKIQGNLNR